MAKTAFIVEVDTGKLFDLMKDANLQESLGSRLVELCLYYGVTGFLVDVDFALYGVAIHPYSGPDLSCESCEVSPEGHAFDCPEAQE